MEIRRSYDCLISTMGFPILVRWYLYIESGPRVPSQILRQKYHLLHLHLLPTPTQHHPLPSTTNNELWAYCLVHTAPYQFGRGSELLPLDKIVVILLVKISNVFSDENTCTLNSSNISSKCVNYVLMEKSASVHIMSIGLKCIKQSGNHKIVQM